MNIMLVAAAALSLGVGLAYADSEGIAPLPTPGADNELADKALDAGAKAPVQKAPAIMPAANGRREDRQLMLY